VQIAGKRTKLADIVLGAILANGHEVKIGADINAGGMEIDPFQNILATFFFALAVAWAFLCHTCCDFLVAGWFFLSAADRPELDKCGNLLNRITPDRETAPIWSLANALTKWLGTKLLIGHKAPMLRRS
jgi:hypothetical protein